MSTILRSYLVLCGVLLIGCLIGCSVGGNNSPPLPGADLSVSMPTDSDMARPSSGADGGTGQDGGARDLAITPDASADLPCAPSSYRCGPGPSVQICNSTGTAWLFSSSCAVSCSMGLCTGGCTPMSRRCNVKAVESCNPAGTAWTPVETCSAACYSGACTLPGLDITASRTLDGEVVVTGDVIVRSGVTITVPTGNLTVRAHAITIETGATITVGATGSSAAGRGGIDSRYSDESGGGGGYGTAGSHGGSTTAANPGGSPFGSDTDIDVTGGAPGADSSDPAHGGGRGGAGGGAIRLIADSDITDAGAISVIGAAGSAFTLSNKGGGGGGSGGGVLLFAGGKLTVSGTIDASGGIGGRSYYSDPGGPGGQGRIKLLAGTAITTTSATLTGKLSTGLTPPLLITSTTHPESSRTYNDDFPSITLSWNNPVASRQGYYSRLSTTQYDVPTPASGTFLMTESQTLAASAVSQGQNFFHIVTVDSMFKPSTIENRFLLNINKTPPNLTSSSHSSPTTWYTNRDAFLAWTFPVVDADVAGVYYVLDHFGDTVPTKADTFIPMPQKQVVLTVAADGIWFMHALAQDTHGYLTHAATHYRVNVGTDPGAGVAIGQITDMMAKPIEGATVSISRGLQTTTTNAAGNYNFPTVPAGTYELRVSKAGYMTATKMISITKGGSTNTGVVLN